MSDPRRYQPRRSSTGGPGWRLWGSVAVVAAVALVMTRMLVGGEAPAEPATKNEPEIALVNDAAASNDDANADLDAAAPASNANSTTNAATEETAAGPADFGKFTAAACTGPLSQYGSAKAVALTFDIAAANEEATKALNILKEKHIPASFFVTGAFAEQHKDFIADIAARGYGVYSKGYDNVNLSSLSADKLREQVTKGERAVSAATGSTTKPLFRPPFGDYDADVLATLKALGYCPILWTVDAFDWKDDVTAEAAKTRVLEKAKPGAIPVLHLGYDTVPQFLGDLADALKEDGYELVTLAALLGGTPLTDS